MNEIHFIGLVIVILLAPHISSRTAHLSALWLSFLVWVPTVVGLIAGWVRL